MSDKQWFATDTIGGALSMATLSAKVRHAAQPMMKFNQFTNIKEAFGKGKHDELVFDKISNITTAGTKLSETSEMPISMFSIKLGTLVITEYGRGIPFSGKVEALSKLSVNDAIVVALRNDMAKALDQAAYDEYNDSDVTYTVRGTASGRFSTTGVLIANNTALGDLNAFHIRNIVQFMKQKLMPTYDGRDYIGVLPPPAVMNLLGDSGWQDAYKYTKPENMWAGEVGRIYGCRVVEETHLLPTDLGGTSGAGGEYGGGIFFGADAVMQGVAEPPHLIPKEVTDYGRSKGLAWYGILGYQKIWDNSADGESRIVKLAAGTGT